jgi:hypothetical protein
MRATFIMKEKKLMGGTYMTRRHMGKNLITKEVGAQPVAARDHQ